MALSQYEKTDQMAANEADNETPNASLSRVRYLSFGSGAVGAGLFSTLPGVLLLFFMTETLGIRPGIAGIVVLLPKLWDVVTDPIMGAVSDRTQTIWGNRVPFMAAGAGVLPFSLFGLFAPPSFNSDVATISYMLVMYMICTTAYTLFSIPYVTLPAELGKTETERARLVGVRSAGVMVGVLIGAGVTPIIVESAGGDRTGYAIMAFIVAIICFTTMMTTVAACAQIAPREMVKSTEPILSAIKPAFQSKPFLLVASALTCATATVSMSFAGLPYVLKASGLGGEFETGLVLLAVLSLAVLSIPVWMRASARSSSIHSLRVAIGCGGLVLITTALVIGLGIPSAALVNIIILGATFGALQLSPYSWLADFINLYADEKSGNVGAVFSGVMTLAEKTGLSLGPFFVALSLETSGYAEGAAKAQGESVLITLLITLSVLSTVFSSFGLVLLSKFSSK